MQTVGVLGAGESGVGAALLAAEKKYNVFVSDSGKIKPGFREELIRNNIPFEEEGHDFERLFQSSIIVKSPGIPDTAAVVQKLLDNGMEIISEIEFAFRHCEGRVLAVTGSNGKTTTTSLCYHILEKGGVDAVMCGNIGKSFARVLTERRHNWYVVEVSSFQLEGIKSFRPDIGIILNITDDHLDRYDYNFNNYANAKMHMVESMKSGDVLVYNASDNAITGRLGRLDPAVGKIGIPENTEIEFDLGAELIGKHNAFNAACAIAACRKVGLDDKVIQTAITTYAKPAHRMEHAGEVNGVRYINDSKATNVDSVFYALDAIDDPVIWIAGGQDKGNDYSGIIELAEKKVKALICLGIDNRKLVEVFSNKVDRILETRDMNEAVRMAASIASPGDVVLLSPACASFDLFRNYEDRGDQFKDAVRMLKEK